MATTLRLRGTSVVSAALGFEMLHDDAPRSRWGRGGKSGESRARQNKAFWRTNARDEKENRGAEVVEGKLGSGGDEGGRTKEEAEGSVKGILLHRCSAKLDNGEQNGRRSRS